jgi:hypothetical protein
VQRHLLRVLPGRFRWSATLEFVGVSGKQQILPVRGFTVRLDEI